MPHQPGHNGPNPVSAPYKIAGSNVPYDGKVVKIGKDFFTTRGGTLEGDSQRLVETGPVPTAESVTASTETDIVTAFVVGDNSRFGQGVYYYSDGRQVAPNTQLHHHTVPPLNTAGVRRNNFMTQHVMDGNELDVFTRRQNARTSNTRRQATPSQTRTATRATNQGTRTQRRTGGMGGGGSY